MLMVTITQEDQALLSAYAVAHAIIAYLDCTVQYLVAIGPDSAAVNVCPPFPAALAAIAISHLRALFTRPDSSNQSGRAVHAEKIELVPQPFLTTVPDIETTHNTQMYSYGVAD